MERVIVFDSELHLKSPNLLGKVCMVGAGTN